MKLIAIILYALFPYLHMTTYEATLSSCEPNHIILDSNQNKIEVSLFNVKMKNEEASWIKTCALLENADHITFEIDPSSRVSEPIPVWLFADDTLIQEALISRNEAYTLIHNPEYTYQQRLEDADTTKQVMANVEEEEQAKHYPFQGPLFMLIIVLLWGTILGWWIFKRKSKQNANMRKK